MNRSDKSDHSDLNTPLLSADERDSSPPSLNLCGSVGEIFRIATWPIIALLFNPLYMVVNAAYVGQMEQKYLASLGLGSLTCGILLISTGSCFSSALSSLVQEG